MLHPVFPMEPTRSETIPSGDLWVAQVKWDGVRVLTYADTDGVQLFNRKKRDRTRHYPEITCLSSYCTAQSVILDGEVIALGENGRPDFHQVMKRDGIRRLDRVDAAKGIVPITYMVFDVLYCNGEWLVDKTLDYRMDVLSSIIQPTSSVQVVGSEKNGQKLFDVMREYDMEGIVAKRLDSPYRMNQKIDLWQKIKFYRDMNAVVGGFTVGDSGVVNAVLLGLFDENGRLWYIGHTGTGKLTRADWRELTSVLEPLRVTEMTFVNRPERYRDAFWVKPMLTAKIHYAEWTEGRALRQPSIQSFVQVPAGECTLRANGVRVQ